MARATGSEEERFVYGSVLDALSGGLYPDKRHVIREFVQNACDAVTEYQRRTRQPAAEPVQIALRPPSITIFDKGIGMERRRMQQYRYVGFSEKDARESAGFRGIGTISGVAVAEKIIATSSRLGVPIRFKVTIDAQAMLDCIRKERNPSLEHLLDRHTEVEEEPEDDDAHYTLVELHRIRSDSEELYDTNDLAQYLSRALPVPFDPSFPFGDEVAERLRMNVADFRQIGVSLNGQPVHKPYPEGMLRPEYEPIFASGEQDADLLAYCWYAMHARPGQYPDKDTRGLTYRVKNFAVGTQALTRETLWDTSSHLAYYFFGEIHLLDHGLVPSSDRSDFEDNKARKRLYKRCRRIAQVANRRARRESDQTRFETIVARADEQVARREADLADRSIPVDLREDVAFQIRTALRDVQKRLNRARGRRTKTKRDVELVAAGTKLERRAQKLLRDLAKPESEDLLYDVTKAVRFDQQAHEVYDLVVEVLRDELATDTATLEKVLRELHKRLRQRFA